MLRVNNLTLNVSGTRLFTDVSFSLERGETLLIAGPSGGGKSTLLRSVLGFEPIEKGEILFYGERVRERKLFAFISQHSLYSNDTLREFLDTPFTYRANMGLKTGELLENREMMLKHLNLEEGLLDTSLNRLSGGEKQRAVLIQTLQLTRSIRVFDEPTSSLDPEDRKRAIELIQRDRDAANLVVSHDREWFDQSSRVMSLEDGVLREADNG